MTVAALLVLASATLAVGQRPFFAGSKPIGYPIVTTTEGLGDRFGEIDGTTQRLPLEANGDRDLVDRLSKLPIDNQPFWLINWMALEANRQKPQTYPQRPNVFLDPTQSNSGFDSNSFNSSNTNFNSGNTNFNSGNVNSSSNSSTPNFSNSVNANAVASGTASGFVSSNRFGVEEYPIIPDSKLENAFTNSNSESGLSNSGGVSTIEKKKSVSKVNKTSQGYLL